MENLSFINFCIACAFVACSFYQIVYTVVKFIKKKKTYTAKKLSKYAVVVSARNEETVIGQLVESIRKQDYSAELVDIYVVADNCTDKTAEIAENSGAVVYERFDKKNVGKGYALHYLFDKIQEDFPNEKYDGYFIFDADNLLDVSYITEMNKVFTSGYPIVTSYRNTKNFGDSWISAGYGLWFLRESEFMNGPRAELGVNCIVSGTGYLFSDEILKKIGNWNYFSLTEDWQFTADMALADEKIGYCSSAHYYDEQPIQLGQSIQQRSRWIKGCLQMMGEYGASLAKKLLKGGSFSCYDILMNSLPIIVITSASVILNMVMFVAGIVMSSGELPIFFESLAQTIVNSYIAVYITGAMALVTEWKNIRCVTWKKVLYSFTYPFFVLTFMLAMMVALFSNVQWKPIEHTVAMSISDIKSVSSGKERS
jgi:Glycosyltransferases, probably involved in cell wall biogenesis